MIIYVDNQSIGKDVWFDNLAVEHYTGGVQEENHYYPFGLTLQMDAEANAVEQPYKYQTKELEKSFGIEMYDFNARMIDPQLGRTWQPDPHAHLYPHISPYASMNNDPVNFIDPDGKDARTTIKDNVITISSTVHVTGGSEQDRQTFVKNSNDFVADMKKWGNTNGTYTDANGQNWTINIEVNYVEGGSQDFVDGDNTLDISKIHENGRSKVNGGDKWSKEDGWDYNTAGSGGTMRGGERVFSYGYTAYHETLHFLGG